MCLFLSRNRVKMLQLGMTLSLSSIVDVEPKYEYENTKVTFLIRERYSERYNALMVVSNKINLPKPSDLQITAVDDLRLKIFEEGKLISAPKIGSWIDNGRILIESDRKWEALGLALVQKKDNKGLSNLIENLLRAKNNDHVIQRLRDLGIPESSIDDIESDFKETVKTADSKPPVESAHQEKEVVATTQEKLEKQPGEDIMSEQCTTLQKGET